MRSDLLYTTCWLRHVRRIDLILHKAKKGTLEWTVFRDRHTFGSLFSSDQWDHWIYFFSSPPFLSMTHKTISRIFFYIFLVSIRERRTTSIFSHTFSQVLARSFPIQSRHEPTEIRETTVSIRSRWIREKKAYCRSHDHLPSIPRV